MLSRWDYLKNSFQEAERRGWWNYIGFRQGLEQSEKRTVQRTTNNEREFSSSTKWKRILRMKKGSGNGENHSLSEEKWFSRREERQEMDDEENENGIRNDSLFLLGHGLELVRETRRWMKIEIWDLRRRVLLFWFFLSERTQTRKTERQAHACIDDDDIRDNRTVLVRENGSSGMNKWIIRRREEERRIAKWIHVLNKMSHQRRWG